MRVITFPNDYASANYLTEADLKPKRRRISTPVEFVQSSAEVYTCEIDNSQEKSALAGYWKFIVRFMPVAKCFSKLTSTKIDSYYGFGHDNDGLTDHYEFVENSDERVTEIQDIWLRSLLNFLRNRKESRKRLSKAPQAMCQPMQFNAVA